MATATELKALFETGDTPTGDDFAALIDLADADTTARSDATQALIAAADADAKAVAAQATADQALLLAQNAVPKNFEAQIDFAESETVPGLFLNYVRSGSVFNLWLSGSPTESLDVQLGASITLFEFEQLPFLAQYQGDPTIYTGNAIDSTGLHSVFYAVGTAGIQLGTPTALTGVGGFQGTFTLVLLPAVEEPEE